MVARVDFALNSEDAEKAENTVFEDIEGLELILKDGSRLEIVQIDWDLINEAEKGNVSQFNINDFDICEEE